MERVRNRHWTGTRCAGAALLIASGTVLPYLGLRAGDEDPCGAVCLCPVRCAELKARRERPTCHLPEEPASDSAWTAACPGGRPEAVVSAPRLEPRLLARPAFLAPPLRPARPPASPALLLRAVYADPPDHPPEPA